jgi:hypothetical protein
MFCGRKKKKRISVVHTFLFVVVLYLERKLNKPGGLLRYIYNSGSLLFCAVQCRLPKASTLSIESLLLCNGSLFFFLFLGPAFLASDVCAKNNI